MASGGGARSAQFSAASGFGFGSSATRGSSDTIADTPGNREAADDDPYHFEKKSTDAYATAGASRAGPSRGGPTSFAFMGMGGGPRTGIGIGMGGRMPLGTAAGSDAAASGRPMTSVRAAGYSSRGRQGVAVGANFDPFNQAGRATPSSDKQAEITPEEQIKTAERRVTQIIEESTLSAAEGNLQHALDKAKEAGKKERQLSKQRDQLNLGDQLNLDLTYCVLFNLANQYHANKMYQEALNSYAVIVKNKLFNQSGRLRVNMGNIYFEQRKFSQAIKMYRMALDQIPSTSREFRLKIMRNIGCAFIKMGQFQDAITSLEAIMEGSPDHHTGFNLALCYFAVGDKDKMKRGFQRLISIPPPAIEQNDEFGPSSKDEPIEDHEVFNEDALRSISRERKKAAERYINLAAKLIAPSIDSTFTAGYDWIIEALKSSSNPDMASELEIAKSIQFLKTKDFTQAIETLKTFEKKDPKLVGTAATNLSFLYFLDGDLKQSEKYADIAVEHDRYNAKAQTNRGNIDFSRGSFDRARERYQEAVSVDAVCTEAMYNLGLVYKRTDAYSEALHWFEKLHTILRSNPEVIYQIADIYDRQGNLSQAMEWFNILISVVPTDPAVLARLGDMFERDGDKSQAFQYYSESYRYFPCSMPVIAWLGAYYVDCEVYEQAIQFFERATLMQPSDVKWPLMIASCYRRSGNYQQAFETYRRMHEKFPDNVECLRFLVRISTDLGMKEVGEYAARLARAEKAANDDTTPSGRIQSGASDAYRFSANAANGPRTGSGSIRGTSAAAAGTAFVPPHSSAASARKLPDRSATPASLGDDSEFHEDVAGLLPD